MRFAGGGVVDRRAEDGVSLAWSLRNFFQCLTGSFFLLTTSESGWSLLVLDTDDDVEATDDVGETCNVSSESGKKKFVL